MPTLRLAALLLLVRPLLVRPLLLWPLLLCSAGCDVFYSVTRTTAVPTGLDVVDAEARLRAHPGCIGGRPWDGRLLFLEFRLEPARAFVDVDDQHPEVGSSWTAGVPDVGTLRASLELQRQLILCLQQSCAEVPSTSAWDVRAPRPEMQAQLAAAAAGEDQVHDDSPR